MRQIGKIKCVDVPSNQDDADLIILFHGFGADAFDLQTLSEVVKTPKPTDWIFPQGPLEVPIGPGWTGRAWWHIDMNAIQDAASRGETKDLSTEAPAGLIKIRPVILEMIKQTRTPWNKIILGGFSQGAMLATDIFLHAPEAPKGLIVLSGALINQEEWKKLAPNRKGSKFFQSHGQQDMVLGFKGAQRLETLLTQAGLQGRLTGFSGGHEIPMQTLNAATEWLKSLKS